MADARLLKLTLHLKSAAFDTPAHDPGGGHPAQYEVLGLPSGHQAWIARSAEERDRWQVLRAVNGVQGDWTGSYETAEDALASLWRAISRPNAGDVEV